MTVLPEDERAALELLSLGYSRPQIAAEFNVSLRTVKRWLEGAYIRLGAVNACSAVRIAVEWGYLTGKE